MSIAQRNIGIRMRRDDLDNLPRYTLPRGFEAKWYRPGDQRLWLDIQYQSERWSTINEAKFETEFGRDDAALGQRMCFLCDVAGEAVATASAWHNGEIDGEPAGRLHWVAVVPRYQGKGLSKPLLSIVCERMRELGHTRAMLATSTARPAAVNLYLHFGFRPMIRHDSDQSNWDELAPHLKYPIC
jgi:GNAT superfamily N-acetyltransferase